MTIVLAILAFCVIILVHEFGHFAAAKLCGIRVYEFSLGMGPTLLKKKGKETVYSLKLLPIGGSCQMGEDTDSDDPNGFKNKPVWKRMIVIVAGAVLNLVLGFIVIVISVAVSGKIVTTQIHSFAEHNYSSVKLEQGDKITKINGMNIYTSMDISYALQNNPDGIFDFEVIRNGSKVKLTEVPFEMVTGEDGKKTIRFDFIITARKADFLSVMDESARTMASTARLIWITLFDLIKGRYGLNDLSGPVGVVTAIDQVSQVENDEGEIVIDYSMLLSIVAFISVNVGIFNLLPFPALDGGRLFFLIVEAVRRKPIKAEYEGYVHFAGFALLMILMIVVTVSDILKLV